MDVMSLACKSLVTGTSWLGLIDKGVSLRISALIAGFILKYRGLVDTQRSVFCDVSHHETLMAGMVKSPALVITIALLSIRREVIPNSFCWFSKLGWSG